MRSNLVPPNCLVDGEVTIRCAHGDTVIYPLAEARICVGGRELTVLAAVSDTLPVSMLLGRDVPELMALLGKEPTKETKPQTDPVDHDILAVTTRAQAAQRDWEEEQLQEREEASGAHAASLDDTAAGETDPSGDDAPTFHFDESIFIESPAKPRMSRREKRENNRRYSSTNATLWTSALTSYGSCRNKILPCRLYEKQPKERVPQQDEGFSFETASSTGGTCLRVVATRRPWTSWSSQLSVVKLCWSSHTVFP